MTNVNVTYNTIFSTKEFVTGVRQDAGKEQTVVLTGNHPGQSDKQPQALLYRGPLYPTDSSGYAPLTPVFDGQTVTTSTFYGPNTPLFNAEIGKGNVRAVGSYKYSEGGKGDHGMMYEGAFDGSGTWTIINVPQDVAGGTVFSTIVHSTMGDLAVGNYDLLDQPGSACAFIYNIKTRKYTKLDLGPLTTAYGIWQNGGDGSHDYTIVGGYKGKSGINEGFLIDYDATTDKLSNLTAYSYKNKPGIITHFEGITAFEGGYSLAATTDAGAAFVVIPRKTDTTFGLAEWFPVGYPGDVITTTGNTVIDNNLMGIYISEGGGVQSYVATITQD